MRLPVFLRLKAPTAMLLGVMLMASALLGGCNASKEAAATQIAVKVNKEELTVHQVNAALSQQRGLRPEQSEEASRRVLERLIDQELAIQKAAEFKLDRDPRVMLAIEAARREIIARSYVEKLGESAAKPTPGEIKKYYDENPALFRQRHVYQFQEIAVRATPDQVRAIREKLPSAKTPADLMQQLKSGGLVFTSSSAVRAAEQVPLSTLAEIAKLEVGQALVNTTPSGANVLYVLASRLQPIDEDRAAKAIEQFLHNDRKRKLVADEFKTLRASAKIEYVGSFAGHAPVGDAAGSAVPALDARQEGEGLIPGPHATAPTSAIEAVEVPSRPASDVEAASIRKGLGLK